MGIVPRLRNCSQEYRSCSLVDNYTELVTAILLPDIWLLPLLEESAIFSLFIYNEVVSRIKTIWSGYEMNKFWNNRNNSAAFRYWISIYCQVGILGDLRAGFSSPAREYQ
jgi:hypothetical protein